MMKVIIKIRTAKNCPYQTVEKVGLSQADLSKIHIMLTSNVLKKIQTKLINRKENNEFSLRLLAFSELQLYRTIVAVLPKF